MAAESSEFAVHDAGGDVRGLVVDAGQDSVILALYDRNEVWRADLASGQVLGRAGVGLGPAALALGPAGETLAVVCDLAQEVRILQADTLETVRTFPCGRGAVALTPLGHGGIAVANVVGAPVTLLDATGNAGPVVTGAGRLPAGLASDVNTFAVAVRIPEAVQIYARSGALIGAAPLTSAPRAVAATRFGYAVATREQVVLVDAASGEVLEASPVGAAGVADGGGRILALSDTAVHVFDGALQPQAVLPLAAPASTLAAGRGWVVAASGEQGIWQAQRLPATRPAPTQLYASAAGVAPSGTAPERSNGTPIVEAEPAESVPASEEPPPPAPSPRTAPGEQNGAREDAADVSEEAAERPSRATAPPSPVPLLDLPARRLTDTFAEPDFGERGTSFVRPDLSFLRNMEAETLSVSPRTGEWLWEGDVRLTLDNTDFYSDSARVDFDRGRYEAWGGVRIVQELAELTAERLVWESPLDARLEAPPPLMEYTRRGETEAGDADPLIETVIYGQLAAEDIHILEPTREITADTLYYDFITKSGEATNVRGRTGEFYFGASKIRVLGPASADGEDVWITTCHTDPPAWAVRVKRATILEGRSITGTGARLQIAGISTPVYWPKWTLGMGPDARMSVDFDSGRAARLGYYINAGQQYAITPQFELGGRLFPTQKEGVGLGIDAEYDYTKAPASPLFLGEGELHTLYTTEDRGHVDFFHRHKAADDTILLLRAEQWSDQDFYKDFYYERYRHRTEPRTYANLTYTQPTYLATATVKKRTHDFTAETERLPEATFHLIERELFDRAYFAFDTYAGYHEREPAGAQAVRFMNVARLSRPVDLAEGLSITPFYEAEAAWYSSETYVDDANFRFSNMVGTTVQTRFHKAYPGALGFSGFKHMVVPSMTYSYRPKATLSVERTPKFDALDATHGRSRLETKIDNVLFGQDAQTGQTWQVARLSLFQGNDFSNEFRKSTDYEAEFDIRPRPWWGALLAAERHKIPDTYTIEDLSSPFFPQRLFIETFERFTGRQFDSEAVFRYNARFGDYDRILSLLYYDDRTIGGRTNGRLGFAYTKTLDDVFNREILYGIGHQITERWSLGFEHRYDFERDEFTRQTYEVRRTLDCWEWAVTFTDRETGWDIGAELNVRGIPGTRVRF